MLTTLSIKNLALVDALTWPLGAGLIGVTGETGAGKSIIVGALKLVLGERADFVVLSGNPLDSSAEQIRQLKVLETWVGGRKVYDAVRPVEDDNAPVTVEGVPGR